MNRVLATAVLLSQCIAPVLAAEFRRPMDGSYRPVTPEEGGNAVSRFPEPRQSRSQPSPSGQAPTPAPGYGAGYGQQPYSGYSGAAGTYATPGYGSGYTAPYSGGYAAPYGGGYPAAPYGNPGAPGYGSGSPWQYYEHQDGSRGLSINPNRMFDNFFGGSDSYHQQFPLEAVPPYGTIYEPGYQALPQLPAAPLYQAPYGGGYTPPPAAPAPLPRHSSPPATSSTPQRYLPFSGTKEDGRFRPQGGSN